MFHKPVRYSLWLVFIILTSIVVLFSEWKLWLIDARAFLVPVIFGCFWWIVECGHVLYNYNENKEVDEDKEESWFWLYNKNKMASKFANDITLMNSQPPWSWDDPPPKEVFDVLGRVQTAFAFLIIICLIVVIIISRVLRLPMPLGDAVKMLGGVGVLKELARFGYRIITGGWFVWYAIANVLGRRAATRDSTIKPISKLEKYYIKIHDSYKQYDNLVDVLRFDKHTKLFELYRKLALTEIGTHWIVIVILAIMSVTTLINNNPPKPMPPEMTNDTCCKLDDLDATDTDTIPEEGIYTEALKANAKWSLQTGIEFIKQLLFPIAYVLIGIATYSVLMLLLLYTSSDWVEMTGKTFGVVVKDLSSGSLFAIVAVGIAMFIMNFLRYTEQLNSLLDYVVAHIFVVILAFCILTFSFA